MNLLILNYFFLFNFIFKQTASLQINKNFISSAVSKNVYNQNKWKYNQQNLIYT